MNFYPKNTTKTTQTNTKQTEITNFIVKVEITD